MSLKDTTACIPFCVAVNGIALERFIGKINVSLAERETRPWETEGLSAESLAAARPPRLTGDSAFHLSLYPESPACTASFKW